MSAIVKGLTDTVGGVANVAIDGTKAVVATGTGVAKALPGGETVVGATGAILGAAADAAVDVSDATTTAVVDGTKAAGDAALEGTKMVPGGATVLDGASYAVNSTVAVADGITDVAMVGVNKSFTYLGVEAGFQSVMGEFGVGVDASDEGLEKLFKSLDADASGNISKDELATAITQLYKKALDDALIDDMMKTADTDNDGEISLEEFKVIMRAGPRTTPTLNPKHIRGINGDKPAGKPADCIGYVAEGASFFGTQYDAAKFPITKELEDKGLKAEEWAEICTSLRKGKGFTGMGGGFTKAIAAANNKYLWKIGCLAAYCEYGPGQKAMVVITKEVAADGRVGY
jgi:hypothetical protein